MMLFLLLRALGNDNADQHRPPLTPPTDTTSPQVFPTGCDGADDNEACQDTDGVTLILLQGRSGKVAKSRLRLSSPCERARART